MIGLFLWAALAVVIVHLCSLLETTLFCVRTAALAERAGAGNRGAKYLLEIKQDRIDDAIGAILILNTLAATVGLTFAGALSAQTFGQAWVSVISAALSLVLLIVSELVPKALAARYAGGLSGFAGHVLFYLVQILSPVLMVTRSIVRLVARRPGEHLTRGELATLIARAPMEGVITAGESTLLGNLMYSSAITLRDAMTPIPIVFTMDAQRTVGALIAAAEASVFSRIPIFEADPDDIIGYVSQREVLRDYAINGRQDRRLEAYRRPLPVFDERMRVGPAVEELLARHEGIALVVGTKRRPVGIATLEDLLEATLGVEITDEAEDISRLRPAVAQSRRSRADMLRRRRLKHGIPLDGSRGQ